MKILDYHGGQDDNDDDDDDAKKWLSVMGLQSFSLLSLAQQSDSDSTNFCIKFNL